MNKVQKGSSQQQTFGEFSQGSMVSLDDGRRLRLDDKVDFWPATGTWQVLATGEEGTGPTSMFAYLAEQRTLAGQPVPKPVAINSKRQVFCNYCGKRAGLFTGKDVYPHREDLHERRFWVCWPCNAWVGCHKAGDGTEPLGMLADEPLRNARSAAHNAFDPLWQNGEMSREDAYAWLADAMGISALKCHIGWMDIDECRRVLDVMATRDSIPF
ncbi:MAG: zinc-finger-containing protein [Piscinibacter sp.]